MKEELEGESKKKKFHVRILFTKCIQSHLEKAMAPHSSTLAWRIPWAEEPAVHGVARSQT